MRKEILQFGIRQISLHLLLKYGLAFRRWNFGEKSNVPRLERVFPEFSFAQEKAQRSQPSEMPAKDLLQSWVGPRRICMPRHQHQLVGQDQAVRDELSGKHESVVRACIALLIF